MEPTPDIGPAPAPLTEEEWAQMTSAQRASIQKICNWFVEESEEHKRADAERNQILEKWDTATPGEQALFRARIAELQPIFDREFAALQANQREVQERLSAYKGYPPFTCDIWPASDVAAALAAENQAEANRRAEITRQAVVSRIVEMLEPFDPLEKNGALQQVIAILFPDKPGD